MATDMDIEMDIDMGLTEEEFAIPDMAIVTHTNLSDPKPILTAPNDSSNSSALEPTPEKVHLRGLDDFTTKDIKAFAAEHSPEQTLLHVEWIDDTSANLVFDSTEAAQHILRALAAEEIGDLAQIPVLQAFPAKPSSSHPQTRLEVRFAVVGDRKQAGARERSRFYLLNPEYDPAERRKGGAQRGGNKYRDRDDGGYRSQRYDDREQRIRQDKDRESGFNSSLYDDDEAALVSRRNGRRDSSSDSRGQRLRRASRRELFPDQAGDKGTGRLRDRSASPARKDYAEAPRRRKQETAASANRLKAQAIKAHLKEAKADGSKELFPHHRRSDAFDAADETADLFSNKMRVPLTDGSGDLRLRNNLDNDIGFTIRGAAKTPQIQGFSIKGAATQAKELFPSHFGDNSGKELFSGRLEGRSGRRQKAEDLFY